MDLQKRICLSKKARDVDAASKAEATRLTRERVAPCNCHEIRVEDWPLRDATLHVADCMRRCPYCGDHFNSSFDLKSHLDQKTYTKRNLIIAWKSKTTGLIPKNERVNEKDKLSSVNLRDLDGNSSCKDFDQSGNSSFVADFDGDDILAQGRSHFSTAVSQHSFDAPTPRRTYAASGPSASRPDSRSPLESNVSRFSNICSSVCSNPLPSNTTYESRPSSVASTSSFPKASNKHIEPSHISSEVSHLIHHISDFGEEVEDMVRSVRLEALDDISSATSKLWTTNTTTIPLILKSQDCWSSGSPPSHEQILLATLTRIGDHQKNPRLVYIPAYCRGEKDTSLDQRLAIAQLSEPRRSNPIALIGFRLPDTLPDSSLRVPESLSTSVEPFGEVNLQIILTPKFWVTDLHIDCTDGLSTIIGSCTKLWLLFPPTPANLQRMAEAESQKAKFQRIGRHLEGGVIVKMTSSDAIYLPVGCIHIVFTLHGGFLFGKDFTTSKSATPLSKLIVAGLDQFRNRQDQTVCFRLFFEAVQIALAHNQVEIGLKAWLDAWERTRYWADDVSQMRSKARKIWDEFFSKEPYPRKVVCPCGRMKSEEQLSTHFRAEHFWSRSVENGTLSARNTRSATSGSNDSKTNKRKRILDG